MRYIEPKYVTSPKDFLKVEKILFDNGENGYSIAQLNWEGKTCYGIRWNVARREWDDKDKIENLKKCVGMPSSHGYPVWFILPDIFNEFILNNPMFINQTLNKL